MQGMHGLLEDVNGKSWQTIIAEQRTLSEYVLYGIYARQCFNMKDILYPFNEPLMHPSWNYDLKSSDGMHSFLNSCGDNCVALMFHSKNNVPVHYYDQYVRNLWEKLD
jgi:hypothetical protein